MDTVTSEVTTRELRSRLSEVLDGELLITVVRAGHRREVYQD